MGRIPEFSAPASTGQTLARHSFAGKVPLVITFVSDFDTDASARLAGFNDRLADFGARRVQVLAVAKEPARIVREFAAGLGLKFPILADAGGELARAMGVAGDGGVPADRTFIADVSGAIVARFDHIDPGAHAATVLDALDDLTGDLGDRMDPAVR
jgi:peroxiredoxin Q/BCP